MKLYKLALMVISLGLLRASTCDAGIFVSTNGYEYFSPAQQNALALTNALAADGGSDYIAYVEPNGLVTNFSSAGLPWNPPVGLSNVVAISINDEGTILALTTEGTVAGWSLNYSDPPQQPLGPAQVPTGLSNVVAISAGQNNSLGLLSNGTVKSWPSPTTVPRGLTNVVAIDVTEGNMALKADGTVVSWGFSFSPPAGLSNVLAISCGYEGCLALLVDGTLIGWDGSDVYTNLLASDITNTVAISGTPFGFLALQGNGSLIIGGTPPLPSFTEPLANVFYLGRMAFGAAVVVEDDGEPTFTVQPGNQTTGTGGTIYLHARVVGQPAIAYQWQFNGTNLPGATNADLIITNATESNAGNYQAIASFTFDFAPYTAGSAVASVTVVPPPEEFPVFFGPPLLRTNGTLIITATAGGVAYPFTNPGAFVIQQSPDLLNWTTTPNIWTLTNGAIEIPVSTGRIGSVEFYRLLLQ